MAPRPCSGRRRGRRSPPTAVPGCRAEPVPAHPVDVGGEGHLAVGLHATGSTAASTPRAGTGEAHRRRRRGLGGRRAGRSSRRRSAGAADRRRRRTRRGADGVPRACSTGAPAVAAGRVRPHAVGAPTARARPRTAVAAAGRTVVSSVAPGQPRLRARRRAPAPAATRPASDSARSAAAAASRRPPGRRCRPGRRTARSATADRLDGELEAGVLASPTRRRSSWCPRRGSGRPGRSRRCRCRRGRRRR